jgi:ferredoxin-NADP reductase
MHVDTLPPVQSRIHHAQLISRRLLAQNTFELVLAHKNPELTFRPGQFVSVQVGIDADQNPILRSYSIASPPQRRGEIVIVLRHIEGGVGSQFFAALQPGEKVRFTGPMGFFVNELSHPGDAVYIATGTGMAPMLPMLDEALARPETGKVLLFWGLRTQEDVFWQDELQSRQARHPRLSVQIFLSQAGAGWGRVNGRVTGPVLESLPSLRAPTFYLCGNGNMIDEVKAGLVQRGVDRKRQIRTEAFFE